MRPNSLTMGSKALSAAIAAVVLLPGTIALGQSTQYWDTNGTTAGAGATPNGTWSTSVASWSTAANGTSVSANWTNNNNARFAGGTDAANPYTVTISTSVNVNQIGLEEGAAVTYSGGIITFTHAAGSTSMLTGVTSGVPTTAIINSQIAGTSGFRIARNAGLTNVVTIGSTANSFTGGLRVGIDNTLKLGASGVIPDANIVTVDGTNGTLDLNGFDETVASITGAGVIALGGQTLTLDSPSGQTFNGVLSGASGKVIKNGTGTLTFGGGSGNTNTGLTTVNAGTLELNKTSGNAVNGPLTIGDGAGTDTVKHLASNQISNTVLVTINSGGVLDMNGFNETIGSLAGAGNIINGGALTLGGNNGSTQNFSGSYSGTSSLTKNGTGIQTLSGSNSFVAVNFNDGRINFNNNNAAGTGPITVGVNADEFVSTANGTVLANAVTLDGTIEMYATTGTSLELTGPISGVGGIRRDDTGAGTLTLSGNNSFGGGVLLESRGLTLGHKNALGTGTFTIGNAVTAPATPITLQSKTDLTGANAVANAVTANQNFKVTGANNLELSGVVSGSAALSKDGAGALVLSNANTYTGGTTVSVGTLVVNNGTNGKATGTGLTKVDAVSILTTTAGGTIGSVEVASGATISSSPGVILTVDGDATINGTVIGNVHVTGNSTVSGMLAPGNSPGIYSVDGDLTLVENLTTDPITGDPVVAPVTEIELGGLLPAEYDQVVVGGLLTFAGTLNVSLIEPFAPAIGNVFDIFDFASSAGAFSIINLPTLTAGFWDTSKLYTTGEISVVGRGGDPVVPLPASAWMGFGLLGSIAVARRIRRAARA